jgi:maltose O-acetyltransferase
LCADRSLNHDSLWHYWRGKLAKSEYPFRVANAAIGSDLLPAFVRSALMRLVGMKISKTAAIWANCSFGSNRITVGSDVFINNGFFFDGYDRCTIGNNVRLGQFVRIITATHEIGPSSQRGLADVVGLPVSIEDGCWLGVGVTVLPGVIVRTGCVVAAGSVVTTSTESDGLYAGIPARRIREL